MIENFPAEKSVLLQTTQDLARTFPLQPASFCLSGRRFKPSEPEAAYGTVSGMAGGCLQCRATG